MLPARKDESPIITSLLRSCGVLLSYVNGLGLLLFVYGRLPRRPPFQPRLVYPLGRNFDFCNDCIGDSCPSKAIRQNLIQKAMVGIAGRSGSEKNTINRITTVLLATGHAGLICGEN